MVLRQAVLSHRLMAGHAVRGSTQVLSLPFCAFSSTCTGTTRSRSSIPRTSPLSLSLSHLHSPFFPSPATPSRAHSNISSVSSSSCFRAYSSASCSKVSFPPNSILDDQHAVAVNEDRSTGTPVTTTHSHDDNKTTNDATPPNQVCNDENNCVKDAPPAVEIITGPGFIGGMKEYKTLTIKKELPLEFGGSLPEVTISYSDLGHPKNPVVYIMPSMSHSAHATCLPHAPPGTPNGWWQNVVGYGEAYGIDLNRFRVICAAPLGAPYESTSPLSINPDTGEPYCASFPTITPTDQARTHSYLMDALKLESVFAVVGGSMGGMQTLAFAAHFPDRYQRMVSIAATPRTSPSTVALRSVQRSVIRNDPEFKEGAYAADKGPFVGMGIARKIGTMCYRSRAEFDERFDWKIDEDSMAFDVEGYLEHQANKFKGMYDANCYLTLSMCLDLMDLGRGFESFQEASRQIPKEAQVMLLTFIQDALIPCHEMRELAIELGSNGVSVHHEELSSLYGHDAFLLETSLINPRLSSFLANTHPRLCGVTKVREFVDSLHMH